MPIKETTYKSQLSGNIDTFLHEKRVKNNARSGKGEGDVNFISIIEFIDRFKLMPFGLYPVQRFILKLYYNIPLDNTDKSIKITDWMTGAIKYEFTETEYLDHLYKDGRCNIKEQDGKERHELILVLGRRSGKCIVEGSRIPTSDGILPIEDLGDPNGDEWQDINVIVSDGMKRQVKATKFYNPGVAKTKSVRTYAGYGITGTYEHRIKVMHKNGSIQWQHMDQLKVGDWVGIRRGTNLWANDYCNVTDFIPKRTPKTDLQFPDYLDERWGRLLGVLTGDGSWTRRSVIQVTGGCEEFRVVVENMLEELFGRFRLNRKKHGKSTLPDYPWTISTDTNLGRKFLHDLGWNWDAKPTTKHVPWVIWKSPKSVVSAYLSGLFETDGGLEKNGSMISFCTASKTLASEVQCLLLNFGIVSRVMSRFNKKYGKYYYYVYVLGYRSRMIFAEEIKFLTDRKNDMLINGLLNGGEGHSSTESVPYQKNTLRKLIDSVPKSKNNTEGTSERHRSWLKDICGNCSKPNSSENPSYSRLKNIISAATDFGADKSIICELQRIVDADYFWDKIIEIEDGEHRVYDLTVPDGHEFVAESMTNHNSALSSLISAYEVYKLLSRGHPQAYYGMPAGSEIRLLCIANDKDQASIVYGDVQAHVEAIEYFKSSVANSTQTFMRFRTENDRKKFGNDGKGTIVASFKSSVAKGLRGRGVICSVMDEIAFFQDVGQTGAESIYRAMSPALAQFSPKDPKNRHIPLGPSEGRMILISSPDAKEGFFYRQCQLAMSNSRGSSDMLLIQAPTWEVNPTLDRSYYDKEYFKDPKAFATEHGAQFSDRVRGWIEDSRDLNDCIDENLKPKTNGLPKEMHFAGVDFGLSNDGTSIALTRLNEGKIELAYHEIWYPKISWKVANPHLSSPISNYCLGLQNTTRLDIDEIAEWFLLLSKRFYIYKGVFDQWAGPVFEQVLHKKGLHQFEMRNFFANDSSQMYQNFMMFILNKQIRLYDYPTPEGDGRRSPLIQELLELQATHHGKNVLIVEAPKVAGKHDDQSDALARSVLLASEYLQNNPGYLNQTTTSVGYPQRVMNGIAYHSYHRNRAKLHGPSPRSVPRRR